MKYRLLIIDDETDHALPGAQPRRQYYEHLAKEFDLTFLNALDELPKTLRSSNFHAVVLDFVLANWGTDASAVLQTLDARLPVALISQRWGPSFNELRVAMERYEQIAVLFTWDDLLVPERRGMVTLWLDKAIRKSQDLSLTSLQPNEPIRLLQVSDLQFGGELPEAFAAETELTAQAIRRKWSSVPHFIAVTGDIAEAGLPEEYAKAEHWLKDLAKKLDPSWTGKRFLIIPGNHDVCWPLGWASRIDVREKALRSALPEVNPNLRRFALSPFRTFATNLGCESDWGDERQYWVNGQYRNLGVIFFGYNTCEDMNDWSTPTRKVVDETVAKMFAEVRRYLDDAPKALVLGLLHHPIASGFSDDAIVNRDVFLKNLSEMSGTLVTLCGHVHADGSTLLDEGGTSMLQVAASTNTKAERNRPADTARGFNLIELARRSDHVTSVVVSYCRYERSRLDVTRKDTFVRSASGKLSRKDN